MSRLSFRFTLSATLLFVALNSFAAAFTPGNVVVYRVGDGVTALSAASAPVFLDEYTPSGTLVQTIPMPIAASGSNKPLTAAGNATSEGLITLSADGRYLMLAGYGTAPGTASVATTTSTTVNRVIGRIDASGVVDASTALNDSGGNARGATSTNGTDLWITGSAAGIRYALLGGTTSTQLNGTLVNLRNTNIFGGQLFLSTASGTTRVATVGSGTPTTAGQTITNLNGFTTTSPYQFFLADLNQSVAGIDTLYVADDSSAASGGGIQKWTSDGTTWTKAVVTAALGTLGARGLAATVSAQTVTIFATSTASELYTIVDSGSGLGTATRIATAGTNTAFRGVAPVPGVIAAPTVSSIVRANPSPATSASVAFTVTFSQSVTGVDSTDFTLTTSGVSGASVSSVTGSGTTYTVAVSTGTGDGTIRLDVTDDDSIVNGSGAPLGGAGAGNGNFTTGEVYTIDKTAPTVVSIGMPDPNPTGAATVRFNVTFSESVTGVDATDFTLAPTVTGASIGMVGGGGTSWFVIVNTGTGSGSLQLNFVDDDTVIDTAGNPVGGTGAGNGNFAGPAYTIDRSAPSVVSITAADPNPSTNSTVHFTVTFSATVDGVDASDFVLTTSGLSSASISGQPTSADNTVYTVTVLTSGGGTVRLDLIDDDSIFNDANGIPLGGPGAGNGNFTTGDTYTIQVTPAAPTALTATGGDASVTLSWTASSGATSYNVKRSTTSGGPYSTVASPSAASYMDTGVTNGTQYFYVVRAVNGAGESPDSNEAAATPFRPTIVISQLYGGGGNTGAQYQNDFVELFNRGTTSVSVAGWTVQYASTAGTFSTTNTATITSGTIAAGQYFLIRLASGGANGVALPTPDSIPSTALNMSATSGKLALATDATTVTGPTSSNVMDFIGYGTANAFEGSGAAGTLSNTTAAFRNSGGCTDTNNNNLDFTVAAPNPRNSSTIAPCNAPSAPTGVGSVTPSNIVSGVQVTFKVATTPGNNPTSTGITVFADLSSVGGSSTQQLFDDGTSGDTTAGDGTFSYAMFVSSAAGPYSIPFTVSDAQSRTSTGSMSLTISNALAITYAIHDIQGSGNASPLTGLTVTTTGIVTGRKSNGFYIQTDAPDSDPNTSEGVFVFTSTSPSLDAAVGNRVNLTATVSEFVPAGSAPGTSQTELGSVSALQVSATGVPLPAPITITAADTPVGSSPNQLERLEGMRVRIATLTSVSPTIGSISSEVNATATSNGIFWGVIPGIPRPFREPGIGQNQAVPAGAPATVTRFDDNYERIRVDSDAIGAPIIDVPSNTTITELVGVFEFAFDANSIYPDPASPPSVGTLPTYTAVSVPGAGAFTIASMNMQRFYDDQDDPNFDNANEVILTTAAFQKRLGKASLAIRNVMHMPDVIGVAEMENLSTLQTVAAKVNSDAVTNGDPNPNYVAYLLEGNDIGGIDVGFLIKSSRVTVTTGPTQFEKTTTYTQPDNTPALLWDRPPLTIELSVAKPGSGSVPIVVIANHLRSLSGIDDPTDGGRVRLKRKTEAEHLASYVQSRQTTNPNEFLVLVGDFNAFQFNDGYVDVLGTIKGTPTPAANVVLSSADLVDPDLTALIDTATPLNRYSYTFDGNGQALDHILANTVSMGRFNHLEYARNNADFPVVYYSDGSRPERLSDHDMPVAYFNFNDPPVITAAAAISRTAGSAATSATIATVSDSEDAAGALSVIATSVPNGITITEITNTGGTITASVAASCTASSGPNSVTLQVQDSNGATGTATLTINVTTNPSPTLGNYDDASALPGGSVTVIPSAAPSDNGTVTVTASASSGFTGTVSANSTTGVISISNANMGTYAITVTATDNCGAITTKNFNLFVYGAVPTAVVATASTSTSVAVSWTQSYGAVSYEVLRRGATGGYIVVGTSPASPFTDSTAAANTAYLYVVRGVDLSTNRSANSVPDLATTVIFTDDPLVQLTSVVKGAHLQEVRVAINAVRTLAGLSGAVFSDSSLSGIKIEKLHIDEMRAALNEARSTLALTAVSYTDPTITAGVTAVKASHIMELRNGVR